MASQKSPVVEILGMAMATVTVLVAALMVLKHEFQSTAYADNSPEEAVSVANVDQPGTAAFPLRSQSELMGGFSSVGNRAAADRKRREPFCSHL